MPNLCENCPNNCCQDFSISTELFDPKKHAETLSKFPFIHQTGKKPILLHGREAIVGVYNCDRFQPTTGECRNYDTVPRPSFCLRTGVIDTPHSNCPLRKK